MIQNIRKHQNIYILILFIILSIYSSILLFHIHYLFGASDIQFHLKRLIELEYAIRHKILLPTFSIRTYWGSAVMSLYPHLNLLPIIILSLFVKSNITLIYIFFDLNIFLSLISSYYGSLHFSKSKKVSLFFAIIYSLSIPFLSYGFYNMDLGALTSIAAFPLVAFGIFYLIDDCKYIQLSIGLIIIIFSHVLCSLIAFGLVILVLLINIRVINRNIGYCISKLILLTSFITSIVWIPAFKIIINNITNIEPPHPFHLMGVSFYSLFENIFFSKLTFDLSLFSIIGIILPILFYRIFYKRFNSNTKQIYWLSLVVVLICSRLFPWELTNYSALKVLRIFQFTYRFYIIPEVFLSYIFSICIVKYITSMGLKHLLIILSIIVTLVIQMIGQIDIINNNYSSPAFTRGYVSSRTYTSKVHVHHMALDIKSCHITNHKNTSVPYYKLQNNAQIYRLVNTYSTGVSPDYYPQNSISRINYINNDIAYDNNSYKIYFRHNGYREFTFTNKKRLSKLVLPILYYKGEHMSLYLNHHLIHYYVNKNNLITLTNINRGMHYLTIKQASNLYFFIIKIMLYIIGLVIICLSMLFKKCKKD